MNTISEGSFVVVLVSGRIINDHTGISVSKTPINIFQGLIDSDDA